MNVFVIIPSRYGSTRFEGKPLAAICGKPMIQRVYESAARAVSACCVAVATDDPRIRDTVEAFGGKAVLTSGENRSGTDRVAEAAEILGLEPETIVVNIQGDQPLLDPECVEEVVAPFRGSEPPDMSTLAVKIVNRGEITDPKDVKVTFDRYGYALYFSRSPIPFGRDPGLRFDTYKHLGIYACNRKFLEIFRRLPEGNLESIEKLEQLRALESGYRIRVEISRHDSPEVDLPEDIRRIEGIIRRKG